MELKLEIAPKDPTRWQLLETVDTVPQEWEGVALNVTLTTPEFACRCPLTGGNDYGTVTIKYVARGKLLELAACWEYLQKYKPEALFHEHIAQRIADDVIRAIDPYMIEVTSNFPPSALCQAPIRVVTTAAGHHATSSRQSWRENEG